MALFCGALASLLLAISARSMPSRSSLRPSYKAAITNKIKQETMNRDTESVVFQKSNRITSS
ncbi:hypothetical protein BpHYR1_042087 [Brachionus plicatilis]|uniref:Uncharacterized protein n=1 Tax=Brachionus plicatilis TaxID=10195 RepID=A0A3M7QX31_BRAPC|nr:hypothetical protein BpHYR1_042087 [Brachionus plicatilis]